MRARTVIESPFKADTSEGTQRNIRYARLCLLDSLMRGEAPFASHLLYPQVLADENLELRRLGIGAGLDLVRDFERTAVYFDHGIPAGVVEGVVSATGYEREISMRSVGVSPVDVKGAMSAALNTLEHILRSRLWGPEDYGALKISWDLSSCTFAANEAPIRTPW